MRLAVATPSGPREAYAYTGGKPFDASRQTVVFVHGALHDHGVWTLASRWFANHGWSALAPDLPGHARSAGAPLEGVEAMADWLLALVDAAGAGRVALVGHSMGSLVALEAAARGGERISHLVLVATAYPMRVSPALLEAARDDPMSAIDSVNTFSHSTLAGKPSYPGPGTWLHGANRALMRRLQAAQAGANLFLTDFLACDRYRGGEAAAERVRCPTTMIIGERDQMTVPAEARDLGKRLHARTVTLGAGHAVMSEAPEALLSALRGALAAAAP
jgi:pimeloyl-ACP methyl ester carboxylesterase